MKSISDRLAGTAVAGAIDAHAQNAVPDRPVLTRAFSLPAVGARELRLDLFRGLALWLIFIDHVSPDLLSWFTIRSYGFSDAAEIFIFISGYTAAFVYGRSLLESPTSPSVSINRFTPKKWRSPISSSNPALPRFRRCC